MGTTEEPCSHVALDFGWFIVHSNLRGVHIQHSSTFYKFSETVSALVSTQISSESRDMSKLENMLEKYEFSLYDIFGMLFLALTLLARRYLKLPLPKSNLWQSTGMFLCTEWVASFLDISENSMLTPWKLREKLLESNQWIEEIVQ